MLSMRVKVLDGHINEVAREACSLAVRFGACIEVEFNGVKVWASPNTDSDDLAKRISRELAHRSWNAAIHTNRARRSAEMDELREAGRGWLDRGSWPRTPRVEDLRLRDALRLLTASTPVPSDTITTNRK